MDIVDFISRFEETEESIKNSVDELLENSVIEGYIARISLGDLNENEYKYVIDYFAKADFLTSLESASEIAGYKGKLKELESKKKEILKQVRDTSRLNHAKSGYGTAIMKIKGKQNARYSSFEERMNNYFGDKKNNGMAIELLLNYATDARNFYHEYKSRTRLANDTKEALHAASEYMAKQYTLIQQSIDRFSELITKEIKKATKK